MSDVVDTANELAQQNIDIALANRKVMSGTSKSVCDECECDIPVARQLALPGVRLCVSCASDAEQISKHFRSV